jgi:tRNA(fMet)-specific endonuclease VapC
MRVALDTNAYRLVMEGDAKVVRITRTCDAVLVPGPVIAELRFGFLHGRRGKRNEATLTTFLDQPRVEVLACDDATTSWYAQLKLQLKRQRTPIPINHVWIAALVLQHGATLLTRDRDFDRIPQLPRI